jgi:uncharacterized protein YbcI
MNSLVGNYKVYRKLVKITEQRDESISILVYDKEIDELVIDPQFLEMIMYGREDIEKLSEEEFNKKIQEQRSDFTGKTVVISDL